MITIGVVLDSMDCLAGLTSRGHAIGTLGSNIPCASVSVLIRSVARMLEKACNKAFILHTLEEGLIDFSIKGRAEGSDAFIAGITAVLVQGLQDLEKDYPDQVTVTIAYLGEKHGS